MMLQCSAASETFVPCADCVIVIYAVCQVWQQTEVFSLFCVKSGSRHLILISNSWRTCLVCKDAATHCWEPENKLLNVESLPLALSCFISALTLSASLHHRLPSPLQQADCRSREYLRKRFPTANTHIKEWGKWQRTSGASCFTHTNNLYVCTHTLSKEWFTQT